MELKKALKKALPIFLVLAFLSFGCAKNKQPPQQVNQGNVYTGKIVGEIQQGKNHLY